MEENKHKHLQELLEGFTTVMLITRDGDRDHARPMAVAGTEGPTIIWFVTADDSTMVEEICRNSFAAVTAQSKAKYLALSGHAELVRDRAKLDELWSDAWTVRFPKGKNDPSLYLIRLKVDDAEYWDDEGASGIRYVFEAAKAVVMGEAPHPGAERHARIVPSRGRPAV
jgi:general stress protein 26